MTPMQLKTQAYKKELSTIVECFALDKKSGGVYFEKYEAIIRKSGSSADKILREIMAALARNSEAFNKSYLSENPEIAAAIDERKAKDVKFKAEWGN